jgi:hypothetical protein
VSKSILRRFDFLIGLGNEAPRSFFSGPLRSDPLDSVRLFSATPPAIPASAAPPATSGVFAFEAKVETFEPVFRTVGDTEGALAFDASSATFSLVLPIGPFEGAGRERALVPVERREPVARALFDPFLRALPEAVLDEPFLLVDVLLELRCEERLERVVWAISSPLCLASLPACFSRPGRSLPAIARIRTAPCG